MKLYNTLSRKKETLKPIKKGVVGFYSCGPTVYNYAHIGNLRTYLFADALERALEYEGFKVKRVMNITDVGHLTSDADSGEDKLERAAALAQKSPQAIAKFYTQAFWQDAKELNIKKPKIIIPATQAIKEQIAIIKKLMAKGYAYQTSQAVYFNVAKFKKYGRLSGQSLSDKLTAARDEVVEDDEKKNVTDFALWFKLAGRHAKHIMHWPSPWGEGFPGWHIECSAISTKHLGQPFDIHSGGVDHIGTHHENEIAQSEAATGKPLAKIWMHGEFLLIDSNKMAKSEGNFITLQTLKAKGFSPLDYRYLCLTAHYRSRLNFSWDSLEGAQNAYQNLINRLSEAKVEKRVSKKGAAESFAKQFQARISDDLDMPGALAVLWAAVKSEQLSGKDKTSLIKDFDRVLGLELSQAAKAKAVIPGAVLSIAKRRQVLREQKKFIEADKLRLELAKKGYEVKDSPKGSFSLLRNK